MNNEPLQERLFDGNKSLGTKKGEVDRILKKIRRRNFRFFDINLIAQNKPMITLYDTKDLTHSFNEWLGKKINTVFYPMTGNLFFN